MLQCNPAKKEMRVWILRSLKDYVILSFLYGPVRKFREVYLGANYKWATWVTSQNQWIRIYNLNKLLYTKWVNKVLLYSTGNYIHYPVINHTGKNIKRMCVCTHTHTYTHTYIYTYIHIYICRSK